MLTSAQLPTVRLAGCFPLPTQVFNGNTVLHPNLGPAALNNVALAFATAQALDGGAPRIVQIERVANNVPLTLQPDKFKESFLNLFHECKYRLL